MIRLLVAVVAVLFALFGRMQQPTPADRPKSLVPVDAIAGIAAAFDVAPVIALSPGADHGDERGPAFLISLIRDPRITATGTDLVIEGGSGRYQGVMDRYVRGEPVGDVELRHIWDDTTQQQIPGPAWLGEVPPIYGEVRAVNASLPAARKMRVLLGDPPIEWENVHSAAEFRPWLAQRESHPAALIEREVIAKGRRALVYFGSGHLQRRQQLTNYVMDDPIAQTIVSLVERAGIRTFVVVHGSERDGLSGWPIPSLAVLRGTALGAEPEPQLGADSPQGGQRVRIVDGAFVPIPREEWTSIRRDEQIDALVYLGPESTKTEAPPPRRICDDIEYVQVRLHRMAVAGMPPFLAQGLRRLCGL